MGKRVFMGVDFNVPWYFKAAPARRARMLRTAVTIQRRTWIMTRHSALPAFSGLDFHHLPESSPRLPPRLRVEPSPRPQIGFVPHATFTRSTTRAATQRVAVLNLTMRPPFLHADH